MMSDWLPSVEAEGMEVPGRHLRLKCLQPVSGDASTTVMQLGQNPTEDQPIGMANPSLPAVPPQQPQGTHPTSSTQRKPWLDGTLPQQPLDSSTTRDRPRARGDEGEQRRDEMGTALQ